MTPDRSHRWRHSVPLTAYQLPLTTYIEPLTAYLQPLTAYEIKKPSIRGLKFGVNKRFQTFLITADSISNSQITAGSIPFAVHSIYCTAQSISKQLQTVTKYLN